MDEMSRAAYIISQSVAELAEIEGMKAANKEREGSCLALAYDEAAFFKVIEEYGLGSNYVMAYLQGR